MQSMGLSWLWYLYSFRLYACKHIRRLRWKLAAIGVLMHLIWQHHAGWKHTFPIHPFDSTHGAYLVQILSSIRLSYGGGALWSAGGGLRSASSRRPFSAYEIGPVTVIIYSLHTHTHAPPTRFLSVFVGFDKNKIATRYLFYFCKSARVQYS